MTRTKKPDAARIDRHRALHDARYIRKKVTRKTLMPQQRQRAPPWERWKLFRAAYLLARPGAVRDLRWRWMATAAAASAEVDEARFTALAGTLLGVRVGEHAIHGQQLSRLLREIFAALVSESRHVVDLRELVVALVILHGASSESNESVRGFLWQMYDEQNRGWISKAQAASLLWSLASSRRSAHHLANVMQDLKTKVKSAELKELLSDHLLSICRVDAQSPHDRASHALKVGIVQAQQLKGRTELLQTQRAVRHMQQYRLRARFCTWRARAEYERIVRTSMRIGQTHVRHKGAAKAFDRLRDYARARRLLAGQSQRASVLAQRHLLQRSVRQWLAWCADQVFRRSIRQRAFAASYQRGFRHLERAVTISLSIKLEKRFWTWQNLWRRARRKEEEKEEEEEGKGEKRRAK